MDSNSIEIHNSFAWQRYFDSASKRSTIGRISPGLGTSEVCDGYLDSMQSAHSTSGTRVCVGALAAHELAHGCLATEERAELVETATRKFLNSHFGVSMTRANCGAD
jgi:hypothetical protein